MLKSFIIDINPPSNSHILKIKHNFYNKSYIYVQTQALLELKKINLCHKYRAWPAFTSMQSNQALYCWLTNFKVLILTSLKMTMKCYKHGRCIIQFKKFSRLRVRLDLVKHLFVSSLKSYICMGQ